MVASSSYTVSTTRPPHPLAQILPEPMHKMHHLPIAPAKPAGLARGDLAASIAFGGSNSNNRNFSSGGIRGTNGSNAFRPSKQQTGITMRFTGLACASPSKWQHKKAEQSRRGLCGAHPWPSLRAVHLPAIRSTGRSSHHCIHHNQRAMRDRRASEKLRKTVRQSIRDKLTISQTDSENEDTAPREQ